MSKGTSSSGRMPEFDAIDCCCDAEFGRVPPIGIFEAAVELHEEPARGSGKPYNLEDRTELFGEEIIRLAKRIPRGPMTDRSIEQVIGAGTSIGANYAEASETVSRKDFNYAVSRCVKEAKETRFFLRMIAAAEPRLADEARQLYREARELNLIFASMFRKQ